MKKVLIIADSLAMPGLGNAYEDTWVYKLKSALSGYDYNTIFSRGARTDVLVTSGGMIKNYDDLPAGSDCLEYYTPHIVILQLGIVDCAPRLFNRTRGIERAVVRRLPGKIRRLYIAAVKATRGRSPKRADVLPKDFYSNLDGYFSRCEQQKLPLCIIIKIPTPDERMVQRNPRIRESVNRYNAIYEELGEKYPFIKVIDPLNADRHDQVIFVDGYHPNQVSQQLVFESLVHIFKDLENLDN